MYYQGQGVAGDRQEAAKLLQLAANQGNADAQHSLGTMYLLGEGVATDAVEAERLFRLAADQGHADAQYKLGTLYTVSFYHGEGIEGDRREAVKLLQLAADQGNADAQHFLGTLYHHGEGVTKDRREAERLLRLAAGQGIAEAKAYLDRTHPNRAGQPIEAAKQEAPTGNIVEVVVLLVCLVLGARWALARRDGRARRPRNGGAAQTPHVEPREPQRATAKQTSQQGVVERAAEQAKTEAARKEAANKKAASQAAAAAKEAEKQAAAKKAAERKEAERKEVERKEADRKEAAKKQAERQASASVPQHTHGYRFKRGCGRVCECVPQRAMALLTPLFPELALSAIADALEKADGDARRAAVDLHGPTPVRKAGARRLCTQDALSRPSISLLTFCGPPL
jgi:chemotaxis protein histidine kinase CheA